MSNTVNICLICLSICVTHLNKFSLTSLIIFKGVKVPWDQSIWGPPAWTKAMLFSPHLHNLVLLFSGYLIIKAFLGYLIIVTAPGPGNVLSSICALLVIHLLSVSPLEYKLGVGGALFCLQQSPWCLKQGLARSRCSVSICGMNKWMRGADQVRSKARDAQY